MKFRVAKYGDLNQIKLMIDEVLESGVGTGLNWTKEYPTIKDFEMDLKNGDLFVMESEDSEYNIKNNIVGAVVLNSSEDINYKKLKWSNSQKALVIHRLMVSPKFSRSGNGKRLLKFIEEECRRRELSHIRLDTNTENIRAKKLYIGSGYEEVGVINLQGKDGDFICLEKIL
ncbi:GNAT family N-acetyltransferase [Clostridium sardiniense]|uniref:GNAT family N-acetyltransferase n=1 Tax=Clostridium sardiniense TaxID=29369 RepID=UPI003D328B4F